MSETKFDPKYLTQPFEMTAESYLEYMRLKWLSTPSPGVKLNSYKIHEQINAEKK